MRGRVVTARVPRATAKEGTRTARRGFRLRTTSRSFGLGALSVVVLLVVWHLVTAGGYISAIFLPSPQQVVGQARRYLTDGSLFWHVLTSGRRVLVGFLLAAVVAVPLGIVLGTSRTAKALFEQSLMTHATVVR